VCQYPLVCEVGLIVTTLQMFSVFFLTENFICLWLYNPCGPWLLFQFINLYTVGRTPWRGDQPIARPLRAHRTIQTHKKRTQTSVPREGFETTIPMFEREKTVHALDRSATENSAIIELHVYGNNILPSPV
jgi:hypothetical protein